MSRQFQQPCEFTPMKLHRHSTIRKVPVPLYFASWNNKGRRLWQKTRVEIHGSYCLLQALSRTEKNALQNTDVLTTCPWNSWTTLLRDPWSQSKCMWLFRDFLKQWDADMRPTQLDWLLSCHQVGLELTWSHIGRISMISWLLKWTLLTW